MRSSTLLFRSLAIIIFLAGGTHLFHFLSQNPGTSYPVEESSVPTKSAPQENTQRTSLVDLSGNWKVSYNTSELKGAIVYELKKEGKVINAYTKEYQDENGYGQQAENEIGLTITTYDGSVGKGMYTITYEGEKYNVEATIDIIDARTFKLRYDYYGYSDVETWKKL